MSDSLTLITKIPPSVNHYLGYRAIMKGKKPLVVAYTTAEAKKFKKEFQAYAKQRVKECNWDITKTEETHYYMDCIFFFPRIDMDEQNYYKVLSDSLNGIVYKDDRGILTRTHRIYYDKFNPRIEINIHPVKYRGIFESEEVEQLFESKCKTCKRYKRNCSILREAKEGRVKQEINNEYICSEYKKI